LGAQQAIANISNYTVKSKHLMSATGDWAKFATSSSSQVNTWITTALRNSNQFIINSEDSYYTIYEMGQVIGTKGETAIKVVFTVAGKIITSFPVK
jgi:hypothetical protein